MSSSFLPSLQLTLRLLIGGVVAVLLLDKGIAFGVDITWFAELGYGSVLITRSLAHWGLGLFALGIALVVFGINFRWAWGLHQLWSKVLWIFISLVAAWFLTEHWMTVLMWLFQVSVGKVDPIFQQDLSFFLFSLPFCQTLQEWIWSLLCLTFLGLAGFYTFRLGWDQPLLFAWPPAAQQHLILLSGILVGVSGWRHWLKRYELLYSPRGAIFGASYTDSQIQLPAETALTLLAAITAICLLGIGLKRFSPPLQFLPKLLQRFWVIPLLLVAAYGVMSVVIGTVYPNAVQSLVVSPNELAQERPYIEHHLQFTRQGYQLSDVEVRSFSDRGQLTPDILKANELTLKNVRLWDPEPLLTTYRQLQEIRPYYQFPFVDVDRYWIGQELRQVMHAAREVNYEEIPLQSKSWVSEHFFYTHGYGITLSPVNVVTPEGLPELFIRDIPPKATTLAVAAALPIKNPAIYFGELTHTHVFVGTSVKELDYPEADQNIFASYNGSGGVPVANLGQRLLYSWYFRDIRILLNTALTSESKLLFRRQILQRVQHLAPFLYYDHDPYLVIAGEQFYWILDAYTTSRHYPYSEPSELPATKERDATVLNYIRNPVKAVVDAFNGHVTFYLSDPTDPLIQTYQRIFPHLFQPLSQMPPQLRSQIRYPQDLFQLQTQIYATYHMNDAQTFFNREDQWETPLQVRDGKATPMEPQHLILTLPGEKGSQQATPEFVLLSPFTPANRQNLIAWMAARSDRDNYGKLLNYEFSRQRLVFGPQQVEARINQDPEVSQQLSLWNQHGSRVNQGSLLVIPLDNALLYIQPLYLEAEHNRLPQLTRVIVAYENRVVMGATLEDALTRLFPADLTQQPESLSQLALQQWQQAQEALSAGDQSRYNDLQSQLRLTLERLDALQLSSPPEAEP